MSARFDRLMRMYEKMLLIRRFEEATAKAYASGKIKGFCHLYIGEEPVAVILGEERGAEAGGGEERALGIEIGQTHGRVGAADQIRQSNS